MKALLISFLVVTLISCSKEEAARPAGEPSVTNISFAPIYSGSNVSVKFDVTFNIPVGVKRVNLYRVPGVLVDYELNPESKSYVMYDHVIGDYPKFAEQVYYQFEFTLDNDSKVMGESFQVY